MNIKELCQLTDKLFVDNNGPLGEGDLTLETIMSTINSDWYKERYPKKIEEAKTHYAILEENDVEFFLEEQWGGEDQGSDYGCVWKVVHEGREYFIMKTAWYASHYGTDDWTEAVEAEPKEVKVIEWVGK